MKRKKSRGGGGAGGGSVLTAEADGSYRPKTRETRAAYEALLGMIQGQFGDQPQVGLWLAPSLCQFASPN